MKDVKLQIAGRDYMVACAPGEEQHLAMLGQMIDDKIAALPNLAGQSDTRRFLYAALLLADELHERQQEPQVSQQVPQSDTAEKLEALASHLEALADELEGAQPAPGQPFAQ